MMPGRARARGFTLIELTIVVAIIATILAIAIPNLASARQTANEAQAVATMRAIYSAQALYKDRSGTGQYATTLAALVPTIDSQLATTATRAGYVFSMVVAGVDYRSSWAMQVVPVGGIGAGGSYTYWIDDSGVIRWSKAVADSWSPPL